MLEQFFDKYIEEMIELVRYYLKEPCTTADNALIQNLFKILDCFFAGYWDTEVTKVTAEDVEALEEYLEELWYYAITWSLGVTTDEEGREKFENRLRDLAGKDNKHIQPKNGSIYDYCFYI